MSVGTGTQYTITGLQEFSVTITASNGVGSSPPASVLVNISSAGELVTKITGGSIGHFPPPPSVHLIIYSCLHHRVTAYNV